MTFRRSDDTFDFPSAIAAVVALLIGVTALSRCAEPARAAEINGKAYLTSATPASALTSGQAYLGAIELAESLNRITSSSRYAALPVVGFSMLPTIPPGSGVVYERCALSDMRAGDIVIYRNADGALVEHRVAWVGVFGDLFIEGDNNATHDRIAITAKNFVGRTIAAIYPQRTEASK